MIHYFLIKSKKKSYTHTKLNTVYAAHYRSIAGILQQQQRRRISCVEHLGRRLGTDQQQCAQVGLASISPELSTDVAKRSSADHLGRLFVAHPLYQGDDDDDLIYSYNREIKRKLRTYRAGSRCLYTYMMMTLRDKGRTRHDSDDDDDYNICTPFIDVQNDIYIICG